MPAAPRRGITIIKLFKTGSTSFTLLGFTEKDHESVGNILTSDSLVDIRAITRIYIHCNLASEHTKDIGIGNKHDILGVIPVTAGVFGTIIYQPLNPLKIKLTNNHFKSFKISFKDEAGKFIDFNNIHWSLTIVLNTHRRQHFTNDSGVIINDKVVAIQNAREKPQGIEDELDDVIFDII